MTRESTNTAPAVSDNASPLSLDDAANLDWTDPGEDTGPEEDEQQSDDETVETDDETDGQETEDTAADDDDADEDGQLDDESEPDDEGDTDDDEPPLAAIKDDAVIKLPNGESVTFGEAKSGYLRQADYSRKTQELGNQRRDLEALATNVSQAVDAIAGHLQKTLPPEPDPQLAITNPNEYTRKKALHDHAMAQIAKVLETARAPKETVNTLTQKQLDDLKRDELTKLAQDFPQIRTQDGFKTFFDTTSEVAKQLGYSDDEIGNATDHRLFKLAHYARIGMQAEAAKAKAKDKVKNSPPVAPAKRQKGQNAGKVRKNAEAMRRLSKTGSIHDAMAIEFD